MNRRPKQFDVYITELEPTVGSEMKKRRPCVVVSPNEINNVLHIVMIAPLSSKIKRYPYHVPVKFKGVDGEINLEHIRSIDKSRLLTYLGQVDEDIQKAICEMLNTMFTWQPASKK